MNIKINMLNVGDGDAIIVALKRSDNKQLVILIDGGHVKDAPATIKALETALTAANKKGPDLIICTHYDADHIGGLKKIAEHFTPNIKQVWLHKPGIILRNAMQLATEVKNRRVLNFEHHDEAAIFKNGLMNEGLGQEGELVIESYDQMEKLVNFLDESGIENIEPFSGQTFAGWPEVKVLGPTKTFYRSCYDKITRPGRLLLEEARSIRDEKVFTEKKMNLKLLPLAEEMLNPCKVLDDQRKDHVTEVNQVSVILEITASQKKILFTGDASIESFKAIPDYKKALKDIHWLKVAHHGSHNNSSTELFEIMNPQYAYISGGSRYLDEEVRECLRSRGVIVKTTLDENNDLVFSL